MKKILLMLTAVALLGAMPGCDDDDRSVNVPAAVKGAFEGMFPGVTRVAWSDRGGYLVAEFNDAGTDMQAWFAADGNWRMTEEDLPYAQLPAAVRTAFEAGEYALWKVDDVDKLLREGMEAVYVLEVERGETEFDLVYSEAGVLLRAIADTDGDDDHDDLLPSQLPKAVTDFLGQRYPDAVVVDAEQERGRIEVDILDGSVSREVLFSADGTWISTETEVRQSDVPAGVLAALRGSAYAAWKIDDIDLFETPDGEWYRFELEEPGSDREHEMRIAPDGTILS